MSFKFFRGFTIYFESGNKVAVICYSTRDFNEWKQRHFPPPNEPYMDSVMRFERLGVEYYGIFDENHLRGRRYDRYMITDRGHQHRDYYNIMRSLEVCLQR